jgi:polyhydroxyalkanoate synthesis regulator phasin
MEAKEIKAWHFQEKIEWKKNPKDVCEAVLMALWLIVDNDKPMTEAVKIGCRKHGAKKTPVNKMISSILPKGYLRKKANKRMLPEVKEAIRQVKVEEYNARKIQIETVMESSEMKNEGEVDTKAQLQKSYNHIEDLKRVVEQSEIKFEAEHKRRVFLEEVLRKIIG